MATAHNKLAVLYRIQSDNAKTEPLYKRALAIKEKALGPDHPDVVDTLKSLASLYRSTDRDAEVLALEEQLAPPVDLVTG